MQGVVNKIFPFVAAMVASAIVVFHQSVNLSSSGERHSLKLTAMIHYDFNRLPIRYCFKVCDFSFQRKRSLGILVQLKMCKPLRSYSQIILA